MTGFSAPRNARNRPHQMGAVNDLCVNWFAGQDLNLRPSGYEPDELPGCSTPRYQVFAWGKNTVDANDLFAGTQQLMALMRSVEQLSKRLLL